MSAVVPVTDYTFPSLAPEQSVLAKIGARPEGYQCKTEAEVIKAVKGAKVILTQFAPITRKVLVHLAPGATVVRYGVGVDNVDLAAAKELGINVAYVPDYCVNEVADHTVALMLSLLRRLPVLDKGVRTGSWDGIHMARPLLPLNETTVGLIGLGRIGGEVVVRLRPFGCSFLVHDPFVTKEQASELGLKLTELNDLLEKADAVTLHLPLTEQTRHLIDRERLERMKPTATLVNTARGGLVDADALASALRTRQIYAAALDVFEEEPLPETSPLRGVENLLLSPHVAWYSETAIERLQRLAAEEAARALQSEPLRCSVKLNL